ncbi:MULTISPECIES: DUF3035 domain-containing protein [unclassified Paracoccus (in: a-proteobacteria)]|uniref:DUF3035 domain-containing protein n=1 Tax=unclassified Paracoccus (in: a-proteobacteria) TaxID=2688777 RepID=UPI0012B40D99|nr:MULTISPECIES: DUF3035 domain-containing protein [unclassified Paracoccus (in: a-proteobacteria)]UXU75829.1 DUF3035 domain-containing protein [Paracoccus sp. SMMA_5]UXU81738.1 DUF3035 domain-containing protein [Paracoccus sp. SMMA_5_TC]
MRAIVLTMTLLGLAACSSDPHLMNMNAGSSSPDEFGIVPTRPLTMPADLNMLPPPTPGGSNITDPTPQADAVAVLGGNPAQLSAQGSPASDAALLAYTGRLGRDPGIRQTVAQEDVEWRSRNGRRLLEVLARTNVYYRAYEPMTLDSWAELKRWRPTGVLLPAAPPEVRQPRPVNPDPRLLNR